VTDDTDRALMEMGDPGTVKKLQTCLVIGQKIGDVLGDLQWAYGELGERADGDVLKATTSVVEALNEELSELMVAASDDCGLPTPVADSYLNYQIQASGGRLSGRRGDLNELSDTFGRVGY